MSKSKTVARTLPRKLKQATPTKHGRVYGHMRSTAKPEEVVAVGFPKSGGLIIHRHRVRRAPTPVERAVQPGAIRTAQEDGTVAASDADALRVARAVAEYRKGLMDRLAK